MTSEDYSCCFNFRHRSRSRSHSPSRYERNHRKRDAVDRPPEAAEIGKVSICEKLTSITA